MHLKPYVAALALVLLAAGAAGFAAVQAADGAGEGSPPELADVATDPERYEGQPLRLSGEVAAVREDSFLLTTTGEQRLPVRIATPSIHPTVTVNDAMDVRGSVEWIDDEERFVFVAERIDPATPDDGTPVAPDPPAAPVDPDDNAVEATEQNTVELGDVRYRVTLFRQLNVATPPDDALWDGEPPAEGRGLYMVSLQACAAGGEPARTTADVVLEDAFGRRFEPRPASTSDDYEYHSIRLSPDECAPAPGSAAERTFDGGVLVFDVPFEATGNRPFVLEIGGARRVQLDL